jgi:serine/threonine-protein kinase
MGVVYGGRHCLIGRSVAIKVLRRELAERGEASPEQFLTEARAASAIGHPHIVDVIDFGYLPGGTSYFVMEFLEGQSLASACRAEPVFRETRILHLARQMAAALAAAHEAGIVHRDLKPENIMLITRAGECDYVKILDFGIAKVGGPDPTEATQGGLVCGTPQYMSPEQACGGFIDHRVDIYALGVMLFELATGAVPFDGENYVSILSSQVHHVPPRVREANPQSDISEGLESIIAKCLEKKPGDRFPDMGALLAALDTLAASLAARPAPTDFEDAHHLRRPVDAPGTDRPYATATYAVPRTAGRQGLWASVLALVVAVASWWTLRDRSTDASNASVARPTTNDAKEPMGRTPAREGVPRTSPSTHVENLPRVFPLNAHEVLVRLEPSEAKVLRQGVVLGSSPQGVLVEVEGVTELVAELDGYESKTFSVSKNDGEVLVQLSPKRATSSGQSRSGNPKKPVVPSPHRVKTSRPSVVMDLEDPWH